MGKKIIAAVVAAYVAVSAGMSIAVSNGYYEVLDYKGPFTVVEVSSAVVKGFTGAVEGNPDGRGVMWGEDEHGCYRAFHDFHGVGSEVTSVFVYGYNGSDDIAFRIDF